MVTPGPEIYQSEVMFYDIWKSQEILKVLSKQESDLNSKRKDFRLVRWKGSRHLHIDEEK